MLTVWLQVKIKSITRLWVSEQKYIPPMDTIYTVDRLTDHVITLKYEKWSSTYRKGQLTLKILDNQ